VVVANSLPDQPRAGIDSPHTQGTISKEHLPYDLDEFTLRFNRRTSKARGLLVYWLVTQAARTLHVGTDPLFCTTGRGRPLPGRSQPRPEGVGGGKRITSTGFMSSTLLHGLMREAGPDPAECSIGARMALAQVPGEEHAKEIAAWRGMRGITHRCVNTMGLDLPGPEAHVRTLERFTNDVLG